MRCFQWCVLLLSSITVFRSCISHPLGIRVASLAKQYASLEDSVFDDYEIDNDENNDGVDHLVDADIVDNVYDDYEDIDDDAVHDDEAFNDNDEGYHNEAFEENDVEDDSVNDETDRISGYRPDVALTSPLEYYN